MSEPLLVIADDDADMRSLVRSTLHPDYPDAIEVADGRDLFWQLVRRSFARHGESLRDMVIVADVRMPAYNGLDVLDAWQDVDDEAPMVVITSFPDDEVRDRVERLGATLLPKPFSRAHLRAAVTAARGRK
jgi:FixJ family two-component response regulator